MIENKPLLERDDAFLASPELAAALEHYGSELTLPAEKTLFRRGDKAHGLYLLKSGSARLSVPGAIDRSVGPGALLGVPGTLSRGIYSLTAELLQEARVLFVPSEQISKLLAERPDVGMHMVQMLSREIQAIRERISRLAGTSDRV
ncbi:MAG: Crp/Fnr family transcriptional regulator [Terriglobales bacterium]